MKALYRSVATLLVGTILLPAYAQSPTVPGSFSAPRSWTGGYLTKDGKRKVAIVFVHGVLGDHLESWRNANGSYWPQLVAKDAAFKEANVYVHSYESPKLQTAQEVEELATRLGDFLNRDGVIQDHDRLVFIGHSMGGLIIRAFLVQARLPAKKVPLIYFFGTPSAGANAASLAHLVSKNPQFQNMLPFVPGTYVEALAKKWLATSEDPATGYPRRLWSYCAYEKKEYLGKIVVEQLSAMYLCNAQPRSVLQHHIDIVKPESTASEAHVYFTRAYQLATSPAGEALLNAMNSPNLIKNGFVYLPDPKDPLVLSRFRYRTDLIDAGTLDVECNEVRQGERTVSWTPHIGENMFAAFASVQSTQALSASSVTVSAWDRSQIAYQYHFKGRLAQPGSCPQARANVKIKYLAVEKE